MEIKLKWTGYHVKKNQVVVTLQKTSAHLQILSIFGFNFGGTNHTLKGMLCLLILFFMILLPFLPKLMNNSKIYNFTQ